MKMSSLCWAPELRVPSSAVLVVSGYLSFSLFRFICLDIHMCMNVLSVYKYVYHVCAWFLQRSEEGVRAPETEEN